MKRFVMFGFIPVVFNADGTWQADTGSAIGDLAADALARGLLIIASLLEEVTGCDLVLLEEADRAEF